MGKLTAELIQQCPQYINPVRDREIDLRGNKIAIIENLGATLDQFDSIDFSDNEIRKLDGFPQLKRLKSLLVNNNKVCRIGEGLEESIPNLSTLVLTNNQMVELGDLDPLSSLKKLEYLSLLKNPVNTKKHYRYYVIHKLPQVRVLDFRRVKLKERETASQLFKGKKGKQLEKEIVKKSKTFVPGAGVTPNGMEHKAVGPSKEDVEAIKAAISKANSLEEIEKLNQMLKSGNLPGKEVLKALQNRVAAKPRGRKEDEEMEVE